jgi:hypothetical protein
MAGSWSGGDDGWLCVLDMLDVVFLFLWQPVGGFLFFHEVRRDLFSGRGGEKRYINNTQ